MGRFIINIILIVLGFVLIKYRERIADMFGEAYWMRYVGGVYNFVIILGVLLFFFGIARLTGTTTILMAPIYGIIPGIGGNVPQGPPPTF